MKTRLAVSIVALVLVAAWLTRASAQESSDRQPTTTAPGQPMQEELEQTFKETLTGAVLEGTWQMARGDQLAGRGPLSEPRSDKYTITKVEKLTGDWWQISARIQYADRDVTIPVPLRVKWAETTPIITLDPTSLPLLGRYEAQVMIHRGYYSGIWHGGDYGGVMSGRIIKQDAVTTQPEGETEPRP